MKIGEIASEGRKRLMDDEQPGISWENEFKDKMEWFVYILFSLP
jgi:hypothetical protein